MKAIGLAALGLSLITATAAYAQTTVTREVSEMPVETTITRSPGGTVITRRVLPTVTEVLPSVTTRVTTRRSARRPAYASARTPARTVAVRTTRRPVYAMALPEPVALTPVERDFVYAAIMEQGPAVTPYGGALAYSTTRAPVFAAEPAAVRTVYVIGARLPRDIPLIELPVAAVSVVPAIAPYAYAMLDGHVLLVDPQTGIIVADVTS